MVRLAGFVAGSLTAIALIVLVLGVPEWRTPGATPADSAATQPQPAPRPEPQSAPEPPPALPPEPKSEMVAVQAPDAEPAPVAAAPRWHSFWSPFGSRIAADGFVSRLESVTGFDYRVLKIENGVYEVAFAYTDDSERDAMLSAIASAAGLDLPDT
ncbi:MAG: hypothetical protein QNI96_15320 [Woeseiaceae bacterium]|nr:hypothetical protein [Woeseiaceae bacterium]